MQFFINKFQVFLVPPRGRSLYCKGPVLQKIILGSLEVLYEFYKQNLFPIGP